MGFSEGLRDLRDVGGDQIDRAAISRLASTHTANNSHALIGVVNILGKLLGAVRLGNFEGEKSLGSGVIWEEREVWNIEVL